MSEWSKEKHGVDPERAAAAARGATAAPEWASNIWKKLKSTVSPSAEAKEQEQRNEEYKRRDSE